MFATRTLAGLTLALAALTPLASAQVVESIEQDTATFASVIRVFGSDLGAKPKLVLVQEGAAVKKTKLKVVGSGNTDSEGVPSGPYVEVEIKKAFPGVFQIGVKLKQDVVGVSADTLELVVPHPESADPNAVIPNDLVQVLVRNYGTKGAHIARVGNKKAKITDAQPEGEDGLTEVTIKVPKVANGTWPLSIQNRLGTGVLKNALEVSGSNGKLGKFAAKIDFVGKKPFKAKKKLIGTDEGGGDPGEVNVGAVAGPKKRPKVLGITLPGQLDDLSDGDLFSLDTGAQVLYSETQKDGSQCVWSSSANEDGEDVDVQVIAITDDALVLFLCGKLRRAMGSCGPEVLTFSGMVTAPGKPADDGGNGGACPPLTEAMGTSTGQFVSDPAEATALYGLTPGTLQVAIGTTDTGGQGYPDQVISFRVSFNPSTDSAPATFDVLNLDGTGLTAFSLQLGTTFWNATYAPQIPPTPASMSVTIDAVDPVPPNQFGILGCIRGSFTGTLTHAPDQTVQTFTGDFKVPWHDLGFGQ